MKRNILCLISFLLLAFLSSFAQKTFADVASMGLAARAKGQGEVTYKGTGYLSIIGDGVLIVNKQATVKFTEFPAIGINQPDCIETDNSTCLCYGIKGKVQICGQDITATFAGANIDLIAGGNANLILKGYGIYLYKKSTGIWLSHGQSIDLNN